MVKTQLFPPRYGVITEVFSDHTVAVQELDEQDSFCMVTSDLIPAEIAMDDHVLFFTGTYQGLCGLIVQSNHDCTIIFIDPFAAKNERFRQTHFNGDRAIFLACENHYLQSCIRVAGA